MLVISSCDHTCDDDFLHTKSNNIEKSLLKTSEAKISEHCANPGGGKASQHYDGGIDHGVNYDVSCFECVLECSLDGLHHGVLWTLHVSSYPISFGAYLLHGFSLLSANC